MLKFFSSEFKSPEAEEETALKKAPTYYINPTLKRPTPNLEPVPPTFQATDSAVVTQEPSESRASEKKTYLRSTYSSTHWAYHTPKLEDKNFIATIEIFGIKMAIILNATDARGYRAIARLVQDNMESTFNREYSDTEKSALSIALTLMSSLYEEFGMAVNTEIAGNNSQSVNADILQIGSAHEPSILHGHIIGRGNPATCYISNVPLGGPIAGEQFNMRGDGLEPGNDKKTSWNPGEMERIANLLAKQLPKKIQNSTFFQKMVSIDSLRPNPMLDLTAPSPVCHRNIKRHVTSPTISQS